MKMRTLVVAGILAVAGTSPAVLTAVTQQDFRWAGAVSQGDHIQIRGIHGSIRAEASNGSEVEVVAVKRAGRRGSVEDVRIETVRHDDGVTICAVYLRMRSASRDCSAGDDWEGNNDGTTDVRVDWVVRVPRGVDFVGQTVNGDVEASGMPSDATASTVNGQVKVSAAGVVEATTVNGSIHAATGSARPDRDLSFNTVNGDIVLHVPAGFQARVGANLLNGSIRTDFDVPVTRGEYVGASARGQIGQGGRRLSLETVNGDIEIRRAGGR